MGDSHDSHDEQHHNAPKDDSGDPEFHDGFNVRVRGGSSGEMELWTATADGYEGLADVTATAGTPEGALRELAHRLDEQRLRRNVRERPQFTFEDDGDA